MLAFTSSSLIVASHLWRALKMILNETFDEVAPSGHRANDEVGDDRFVR
jgi:hypothetical protein